MESLRAPVHQEVLQEYPGLQHTRSAAEQAVSQREGQRDKQKSPTPQVQELLQDLQLAGVWSVRKRAVERLGELGESSPRIVLSLIAARADDSSQAVREAAEESLRAPVHQEILQECPDLMQCEKVQDRKDAKPGLGVFLLPLFGIVLLVAIGIITMSDQGGFWPFCLIALPPGVAFVAWGLWRWRSATTNRDLLLRSMKETVGTVGDLRKEEHESDYGGTSYTYHSTVCFEAEDAEDAEEGTRVIALEARVSEDIFESLRWGEAVGIRYAAEDPRIALIEGEW